MFPVEGIIEIDMVRTLINNKRYCRALSMLEDIEALAYEGAREIHDLFVRSHVHLAVENMEQGRYAQAIGHLEASKEFPERLGTGRPYEPDFTL